MGLTEKHQKFKVAHYPGPSSITSPSRFKRGVSLGERDYTHYPINEESNEPSSDGPESIVVESDDGERGRNRIST
jgi:hypothetical protein